MNTSLRETRGSDQNKFKQSCANPTHTCIRPVIYSNLSFKVYSDRLAASQSKISCYVSMLRHPNPKRVIFQTADRTQICYIMPQFIRANRVYFLCLGLFFLLSGIALMLIEQGDAILFFNARRAVWSDFLFKYGTQLGEEIVYAGITIILLFFDYRKAPCR